MNVLLDAVFGRFCGLRLPTLSLLLLTFLLFTLHAFSLKDFPPVFVDEAFLISRGWSWLETGLNYGELDSGVFEKRFDGYWTFHPLIPTTFHGFFIYIFGLDLGLLRLSSFICGAALAASVFFISRNLGMYVHSAFISVLLLTTSYPFLVSAHLVRYDIIVAALAYTAIGTLLFANRTGSILLGTLSGLLLGAAFEVHVNAVLYGPILLAQFLVTLGWRFYQRPVFWGFIAGTIFMLIGYLWLHVLHYPEAYFGIGRALAGTHSPPLLSADPLFLLRSISEMGVMLFFFTQGRIVLVLVAAVILWKRNVTRTPLMMLITGVAAFTLMIKSKMYYYVILISPLFDIILAQWFDYFRRRKNVFVHSERIVSAIFAVLVVASLLFSFSTLLSTFRAPSLNEPELVATTIERLIPAEGSIMGAQTYWFYLHRYRYISWQNILAYRLYESQSTLADAMRDLGPDILVVDDHLRQFILPDRKEVPKSGFERYAWERRLPATEFYEILELCGKLEDRLETKGLGIVEIYRLDWEVNDLNTDKRGQSQSLAQPNHQRTCPH